MLACVLLQGATPAVKESALGLLSRYGVPAAGASSASYLKSSGDAARACAQHGEALLLYEAALVPLVDLPSAGDREIALQLHRDIAAAGAQLSLN